MSKRVFEFGPFRLDERERVLRRAGARIDLTAKAFDVLVALLSRGQSLVTKSGLLGAVWGDVHVDEAVLTRAVSDLRKALGQPGDPGWIETVPKFGYRMAVDVTVAEDSVAGAGRPKRRIWVAAAIVAVGGILKILTARDTAPPAQTIHRLVVLPFHAVEAGPYPDGLGAALADVLITRLSGLQELIVSPYALVQRYEHEPVDPVKAARELRADAVLEGNLQFSDDHVRLNARPVRSSDGKALWADTVESPVAHLFALEDSLAEQVTTRLAVRLNEQERRDLASHREPEPEAFRLYVNGRYEWGKRSREGMEKGAEYFRQAISRDPAYGRAYAGLADSYLLLGLFGHFPQLEMLPKAKQMALRALELDPNLADAHATLGLITQNLDWDWNEVERRYREAIRLAPNYATAYHWYAEFLSIMGRFQESRLEFARARGIDPISPIIRADEAQLYFFQRNYPRALELLATAVRDDPSFALARERRALIFLLQGRDEDAWQEAMTLPDCAGEASTCRLMWTAWLPSRNPSAARVALERLEADAKAGRIPHYAVLFGCVRQSRTDCALDWLEQMRRIHGVWLITAKVNPLFDPLRNQPRMRAVLTQLHLD
ncbi:MAG: winged helix-turn-helix domain-containing protein [Bryobacterales bacterium]|nr:winged helix-turn-helix domain-containing protein [Bryobacterales bacterium]